MNSITLAGIVDEPLYSHEAYGEKFYKAFIATERASGTKDVLCCIFSETFVGYVESGKKIKIAGEIRTRNIYDEKLNRNHLELFVFVTDILGYEEDENYVELNGFVCKNPKYRKTPLGRQVTDLLVASNRRSYSKSDYIPCVVWGRNAIKSSEYEVGTNAIISGRLQSREYTKRFDDGAEEVRTAYELSVNRVDVVEESEVEE